MTTRLSLFDSPMFLGFDHFEETFNRLRKSASEGYPPYNIEQKKSAHYSRSPRG